MLLLQRVPGGGGGGGKSGPRRRFHGHAVLQNDELGCDVVSSVGVGWHWSHWCLVEQPLDLVVPRHCGETFEIGVGGGRARGVVDVVLDVALAVDRLL